jgi:hypothetical protein
MPNDDVLSAGAATAVWAVWTAIELGFRGHRAIPSRDWDQGSLLALNVAHGFRLAGMLVGFLGVGRIDGAGAPFSCPVWDSCSPASLFAGRPFTPWESSSRVASRFEKVTHSYGPGSIRDFVILRMPALCSLTSVSDWRSRTGGPWHAAFCPI